MSQTFHEYLLQEIKCASLRARLVHSDIDAVGIALKDGRINADQAIDLLSDCDCLRYIDPTPPPAKVAS